MCKQMHTLKIMYADTQIHNAHKRECVYANTNY